MVSVAEMEIFVQTQIDKLSEKLTRDLQDQQKELREQLGKNVGDQRAELADAGRVDSPECQRGWCSLNEAAVLHSVSFHRNGLGEGSKILVAMCCELGHPRLELDSKLLLDVSDLLVGGLERRWVPGGAAAGGCTKGVTEERGQAS